MGQGDSLPDRPRRPPVHQPLVTVLAALCAGIWLDHHGSVALWYLLGSGGACFLLWTLFYRRRYEHAGALVLLAAVACVGGAWHHLCWHRFSADEIARYSRITPRPACIEVIAESQPQRVPAPPPNPMRIIPAGDGTELDVQLRRIRDGRSWKNASGRARVIVQGHVLGVGAGDHLRIFGQLSRSAPPGNPGEFDYAWHARADRRLSVIRCNYPDCVVRLEQDRSVSVPRMLAAMRGQGEYFLSRRLDARHAPLAAALLLGQRRELQADASEPFFTTGMLHVLVVSGLHVGILASCLLLGLRLGWLSRSMTLLLVIAAVWLYALVTGARPPVLRAAVLITLYCIARWKGRRAVGYNALALAALIVLAVNPLELFRTGPQLSFMAVAALTALASLWRRGPVTDPLDRLIARSRPWPLRMVRAVGRWHLGVTVAGLAVWLTVTPLTMYRFHLFSPAAVLIGPLLYLPVAGALVAGFLAMSVGWLVPPVAHPFSACCNVCLSVLETAVRWAEATPGSHRWIAGPPAWWVAGFYGMLILWLLWPAIRPRVSAFIAWAAIWLSVGLGSALLAQREEVLRCTFVDVGHGCSILLELPDGKKLLYDAGRLGSPEGPARSIAASLWSRGITHLDTVVISHADADHYNALPELFKRFSVGSVYVSPVMFEEQAPALLQLREEIERQQIPLREIWAGDRLQAGAGATIDVLHPPRQGVLGSDNANSIVLSIGYQGRQILLTGDLEQPGMQEVLAEEPLRCDVLLAPHHGSRNSDPFLFAQWSTPRWLVISGGQAIDTSIAEIAYRRAGATVLRLQQTGAVEVCLQDGRMQVSNWNSSTRRFALLGQQAAVLPAATEPSVITDRLSSTDAKQRSAEQNTAQDAK